MASLLLEMVGLGPCEALPVVRELGPELLVSWKLGEFKMRQTI